MRLLDVRQMKPASFFGWIIVMVMVGILFAGAIAFLIFCNCEGALIETDKFSFCSVIATSPPWTQLAALAAGPAIILTWIWRTIFRHDEMIKRQEEIRAMESQASAAREATYQAREEFEHKRNQI